MYCAGRWSLAAAAALTAGVRPAGQSTVKRASYLVRDVIDDT